MDCIIGWCTTFAVFGRSPPYKGNTHPSGHYDNYLQLIILRKCPMSSVRVAHEQPNAMQMIFK